MADIVAPAPAQQPVDFDYSGPPVSVSNQMALQLVTQFGLQSAWFAFLKLRGMKDLSKEEAEKSDALRCFGHKIRSAQKTADELKYQQEGLNEFMAKQFDTFLESNSLELKAGETEDLGEASDAEETDHLDGKTTTSTAITALPAPSSSSGGISQVPEKEEKEEASEKPAALSSIKSPQEKELQQSENTTAEAIAERPTTTADELLKRRHQETIDDAVSSVMNKIKNNELFGGELISASSATPHATSARPPKRTSARSAASKQSAGKATLGAGQDANFNQLSPPPGSNIVLMAPQTSKSSPYHQQQQNTSADQVTILSNFSEIIRASTSGQHGTNNNQQAAKIITQQTGKDSQQGPQTIQMGSTIHGGQQLPFIVPFGNVSLANLATTPQGITIQGGTSTITVQNLLQLLQQQQAKQQQFQFLQHNNQQETPDSSSQDTVLQHESDFSTILSSVASPNQKTASGAPKASKPIQKRTRKRPLTKQATAAEQSVPEEPVTKQPTTSAAKLGPSPKAETKDAKTTGADEEALKTSPKKQTPTKKTAKGVASTSPLKSEPATGETDDGGRMAELESQLKKAQRQLTTEKNKFVVQKKKLDKLQGDLSRATDSIQLLQIDLACQKTDNNNLIAENIALKSDNQQLKSKETSSKSSTKKLPVNQQKTDDSQKGRTKATGSKRSQQQAAKQETPVEPQLPETSLNDFGRRQSKRICVARSYITRNYLTSK